MQQQELQWEKVDSLNVERVAYHEDSSTLAVKFNNGGLYTYIGVQPDDYHNLIGAESVGKYLNAVIKRMYPYQRFNDEIELISSFV